MSLNDEIKEVLLSAKSHTFSVDFIKKNGEYRKMNAILKCIKHLKGGESTIKNKDYLLSCFDMQSKGYRCIPLSRVISCRVNGEEYPFRTEEEVREATKQEELV